MAHTLTIEDVRGQSAEELLRRVAADSEPTIIVMEDNDRVTLHPTALKPMIVLEGFVPDGWKDALYEG